MRLLLAADLHYALKQLDWVVEAAPRFDVVVLAGDHLDIASAVPLDAQSVVLLRYAELLRPRRAVVVSSGNHDLTGPDEAGEQAAGWLEGARAAGIPTDGDSVAVDDVLLTVCPWWDGEVGRERVARQLEADAARRPRWWVWVYHWPPAGSPTCWTGRREYGDADLAAWIDQHRPDIVLTGHVHQAPFAPAGGWADRIGPTWIFNAGRQIGAVPARVEIDLEAGQAAWLSMIGVEEVALADPGAGPRTVF